MSTPSINAKRIVLPKPVLKTKGVEKTYYHGSLIFNNNCGCIENVCRVAYALDSVVLLDLSIREMPFRNEKKFLHDKIKKMVLARKKSCKIKFEDAPNIIQKRNQFIKNYEFNCEYAFSRLNNLNGYNIIYELVKTKNGNLFGKELYTGLMFPILNRDMIYFNYALVFDPIHNVDIKRVAKINKDMGSLIVRSYEIDKKEVREYTQKFEQGIRGKIQLQKHKNKIKDFAEENDLEVIDIVMNNNKKDEVKQEKEEVVKPKPNNDLKLINEIEYNLNKLKDIDLELYKKFESEYKKCLQENNTSIIVLGQINARIQAEVVSHKERLLDLINYLDKLKIEYINNFVNNNTIKTEIDLKKLDKINELFLEKQDNYSVIDKVKVINSLGLIYLLEVYENKDRLSISELEQSYFGEYLEKIVTITKALDELGVIKCSYFVSLVKELNIKVVFDMIKSVNFIKVEEKELIKVLNNI